MRFSKKDFTTANMTSEEEMAMANLIREQLAAKSSSSKDEEMNKAILTQQQRTGALTEEDEKLFIERLKKSSWWQEGMNYPAKYTVNKVSASKNIPAAVKPQIAPVKAKEKPEPEIEEFPRKPPIVPVDYCHMTFQTEKDSANKKIVNEYGSVELKQKIAEENGITELKSKELDIKTRTSLYDTAVLENKRGTKYFCIDLSDTKENFVTYRNIVLSVLGKKADFQKNVTILCKKEEHESLKVEQEKTVEKPTTSQRRDQMNYIFV
jgi:hypothetical protein